MSPRSLAPGLLALGVLAADVPAIGADDAPPDWIKITPRGDITTRDARQLNFDPEGLVERFTAEAVDVAVDTDHGIVLRGSKGETVGAIGYASKLDARSDGTWAKVDWNDGGKAVLKARTHRYVSPTVYHDETGIVTGLHSISLVTVPALSMPALLSALGLQEPSMKQIAAALGLAETANETACLAALDKLKGARPVNIKPFVEALGLDGKADEAACLAAIGVLKGGSGKDMVAQLQSQLKASGDRVTALEKSARDKDVAELLGGALKDRKIVPAQRESYEALCATDDGLKNVRAMLAATPAGLQDSGLGGRAPGDGVDDMDPATLAAAATKLHSERAAAGQPIGYAEAVQLVAEKKG